MSETGEQSPNISDNKQRTHKFPIVLVVFLLISVITLSVIVCVQSSEIKEYEVELSATKVRVIELEQLGPKAALADSVIAFVTETGEKYHKQGCQYISLRSSIYTVEQAEHEGYEPCSVCHD